MSASVACAGRRPPCGAQIECQGHHAAGQFGTGLGRVGGDIENRGRIVFKAVRGDHSAGDHVDVTETLDRAVIWPPGDAFPDVVVYTPVAEAARVNVVVGDSECPVDEVGGEPGNETGCAYWRRGNNYRVVRCAAAIECCQRGIGVTIQGKSL